MAATAKVTPFVSPAQAIPGVCTIPQDKLAEILALRQSVEQLQAELKQAEEEVRAAHEAGCPVEPGLLKATLKTIERRSVAWKQVCERQLGAAYCRHVLTATKPETYVSLAVTMGGAS